MATYVATVWHVVASRILTEHASLDRSPEAIWGMTLFASMPVLASLAAVYAAWQSSRPPTAGAWVGIEVTTLGGRG
jgi:hypothetical protein